MTWAIEYTETARAQIRKLNRHLARRVVDCLDERIAGLNDPRRLGRPLTGPLVGLWRYRVGDCRVICDIQDRALRVLVVRVGRRDGGIPIAPLGAEVSAPSGDRVPVS